MKPVRFRPDDKLPLLFILYLQVLSVLGLCSLAYFIQGWLGIFFVLLPYLLVAWLDHTFLTSIKAEEWFSFDTLPGKRWFIWSLLIHLFILLRVFVGTALRIPWREAWGYGLVILLLIIVGGVLLELLAYRPVLHRRVPWLWFGTLLVVVPLGVSWVATTDAVRQLLSAPGRDSGRQFWREKGTYRKQVIAERTDVTHCADGTKWLLGQEPMRVAVALSGGGYRAAVTHAGLLAALDQHCVPIRYLTTVSGGSIIGSYYALGYRAKDFLQLVWEQKPALPYEKFDFWNVLTSWFLPWRTDADVYTAHFARVFFGPATLADVPDHPVLIVNATDLEAAPSASREIFFKERATGILIDYDLSLAKDTTVADVVAASGAFPGAFEPKRLRWTPADPHSTPAPTVERRFIDGGVLENLGLEGLRRYLTLNQPPDQPRPKPHVLIIADASQRGDEAGFPPKVELAQLMWHVQGISYDALYSHFLGQYTGHLDYWTWLQTAPIPTQVSKISYAQIDPALAKGDPPDLWVVVIPITAKQLYSQLTQHGQCTFNDQPIADVQSTVARLNTLKELDREEIEKGAWLGYALGMLYWDAINCARTKVGNGAAECLAGVRTAQKNWSSEPPEDRCPPFSTIISSSGQVSEKSALGKQWSIAAFCGRTHTVFRSLTIDEL